MQQTSIHSLSVAPLPRQNFEQSLKFYYTPLSGNNLTKRKQYIITNKSLDHLIVKLFEDDTNCFISGNNFNQLERLVEVELNKLQKWINANKLKQ